MDKLSEIFQRQAAYVRSLAPTYLANGFPLHAKPFPWEIDDRKCQEEFRLLAWRFTEEVMEAIETWEGPHTPAKVQAYYEEVADALHFFVELCLATGVTEDQLLSGLEKNYDIPIGDRLDGFFEWVSRGDSHWGLAGSWPWTLRALSLAMMTLRQRPWRNDDRRTNRAQWIMGMHLTFKSFVACCIWSNITSGELHLAYFKKAKINEERRVLYGV